MRAGCLPALGPHLLVLVDGNRCLGASCPCPAACLLPSGLINLNGLKAKAPLAVSADTVFLAAYRPIVRDIAGNNMSTATVQVGGVLLVIVV